MKDVEKAYIAGILDGEGYLAIRKANLKKQKTPNYSVIISVKNTDKRMLDFLASVTGVGNVIQVQGSKKKTWNWTIGPAKSVKLLNQVKKFLVCKHDQAKLLLQMQEINNQLSKSTHPGKYKLTSIGVKQENLWLALKKLR